ncbi:hatching enzyme 1.2-like [Hoplias malabaricus]|uniref:hatching enzyme 1.2-like n=1 Tax=Hoplias malabaricus TaxID=27720 RepID=UPI003462271E
MTWLRPQATVKELPHHTCILKNMESAASLSILAFLLLGLSQAVTFMEPHPVGSMANILTINNGSRQLLVEGDILIPTTRNALVCPSNTCFWKKSSNGLVQVPYTVSTDFSSSHMSVIAGAMAVFHSKTCIRFVPRSTESDYLSIQSGNGCYSSVGKTGGMQMVSLSLNGCVYHGIVEHELNHALGFYHEHTRSDRDSYVEINWQNINPAMQYNFNKENTNNLNTHYDYSSVMHYPRTAFSINGQDTITPIPDSSVQIGLQLELSAIDIQRINILYKC